MTTTAIAYLQTVESFSQRVQEFHRSLPAEQQQLLEALFALVERAAADEDIAGYVDLSRFFAQHARPFVAAAAVAGVLGLLGAAGVPAAYAAGPQAGVVQAASSLTANPNPIVLTAGQTAGSTMITWDAKSRTPPTFMLSVDGGPEQPVDVLTRRGNTSASVTVGGFEPGHSYHLRMLSGAGGQVIGETTITAELPKTAPVTTRTTATTTNPTTTPPVVNGANQGGTTAAAANPAPNPTTKVTPHGTFADIRVSSAVPGNMRVLLSTDSGMSNFIGDTGESDGPLAVFDAHFEDLQPGTTYFWMVRARGADGVPTIRQGSFRTLNRFVTVDFDSILIGGDGITPGDGSFFSNSNIEFTFTVGDQTLTTDGVFLTEGDIHRPNVALTAAAPPVMPVLILAHEGRVIRNLIEPEDKAIAVATLNLNRPGVGEQFSDSFEVTGEQGILKFTVKGRYRVTYQ